MCKDDGCAGRYEEEATGVFYGHQSSAGSPGGQTRKRRRPIHGKHDVDIRAREAVAARQKMREARAI